MNLQQLPDEQALKLSLVAITLVCVIALAITERRLLAKHNLNPKALRDLYPDFIGWIHNGFLLPTMFVLIVTKSYWVLAAYTCHNLTSSHIMAGQLEKLDLPQTLANRLALNIKIKHFLVVVTFAVLIWLENNY